MVMIVMDIIVRMMMSIMVVMMIDMRERIV
jgi:hypothetical protein